MKKILTIFIVFISLFSNAQVDRFVDGFYIVPKNFPSTPFEGQFHYDDITNIAYFYNGTEWVSMAADNGEIITIENIAPLVLETYIIDLQNGNDATGQYQNGAKPFLTLQAALDDAAARNFADNKNINFRILGTGTAFITKKHSNINCNFYAVDGANISYANYTPIGGDLVVLEGTINTLSLDRKAQNMHFQYYTEGSVIFGNTSGDLLDFGRGFDLTIKASNLVGLDNFQFGRIQRLNIDVLTTTWNYGAFTGNVGGLSDNRILNQNVHLGDVTLNAIGDFYWDLGRGYDVNLSFKSITSNSVTRLDFRAIQQYSNTAKYAIGSVDIPSLTQTSVILYTDAKLTVDVSNVTTWSDNLWLTFFANENVTFTGSGDFTTTTTPLARYRLNFKDANIKMNGGVTTNQSGVSETQLFLDNTNIEYNDYLVGRSGTPATYTAPNIKIKGICYIDNLGTQTDIFDAMDPGTDFNQSIEIDGKLITYNVTYDGSGSNSGTPNPNITVNQHITQESNSSTGSVSSETAASIKTKYESNANTNAFTDSEKLKLTNIETNATADQTGAEIVAAIDNELSQTDWKTGGITAGKIGDTPVAVTQLQFQGDDVTFSEENGVGTVSINTPSNTITPKFPTAQDTLITSDLDQLIWHRNVVADTLVSVITEELNDSLSIGSIFQFARIDSTKVHKVVFVGDSLNTYSDHVISSDRRIDERLFSLQKIGEFEYRALGEFKLYDYIAPVTIVNLYTTSNALASNTYEANATTDITPFAMTFSVETVDVDSGSYALKSEATTGTSRVQFDIVTETGEDYTMTLRVKKEATATFEPVSWVNVSNYSVTGTATDTYSTYTITFTADSTSVTCRFYNGTDSTSFWMDNLIYYKN